jgi:single-stranded-DNA-specific exonuclease
MHAVEQFAKDGVSLLITVDNGITDVEEVRRAQELGIDVIVTDHHLPQAIIPPAYAVVNSKRKEDTYHDNMLCGAAVAWKLVCGILKVDRFDIPEGWEKWLLDMVGISTIADMVPLQKENRALAQSNDSLQKKTSDLRLHHASMRPLVWTNPFVRLSFSRQLMRRKRMNSHDTLQHSMTIESCLSHV